MSYNVLSPPPSPIKVWVRNWVSDWFGLFDILVGIITLTFYYPKTQEWWFNKTYRLHYRPGSTNTSRNCEL